LVVQLVDFDKVVFWYFFTKDLLTKVPPHPESKRTLMRLNSFGSDILSSEAYTTPFCSTIEVRG
jgi:hypothetical protein